MALSYAAVRSRQAEQGRWLVLFSAPAFEIDSWVGVPQKLKLGDDETAGFQRTVSPVRLASLEHFFRNPANTMQNPLLCAIRNPEGAQISFTVEHDLEHTQLGHLNVEVPDLSTLGLPDLLRSVMLYLEDRVPELSQRPFPNQLYQHLEQRYRGPPGPINDDDEVADDSDSVSEAPFDDALFEESQISEFWDQVTARHHLAQKLHLGLEVTELLGFTREVLEAYLRPVVLVDGQHRLQGALNAARTAVDEDRVGYEAALRRISEGKMDADSLQRTLLREKSRNLPVSLLMDSSSAEHVFQFVVVNQKATPVPKALLETIISTSLAPAELSQIKNRLEAADLKLENSLAVSSLARNPMSPFADRVARGFDEDSSTKLPWSVLVTLSNLFRNLRGAKYYHDNGLDHAKIWSDRRLDESQIVADWQARDYPSALAFWRDDNGPWRDVFIAFWSRVRERLASDNPDSYNYWGNPRHSNIFNKPSLFILSVDFFAFLDGMRVKINSVSDIPGLVDAWLEEVSPNYFARDWKLSGVKKDSVGTRRKWSLLWYQHRRAGGAPPPPLDFGKLLRSS